MNIELSLTEHVKENNESLVSHFTGFLQVLRKKIFSFVDLDDGLVNFDRLGVSHDVQSVILKLLYFNMPIEKISTSNTNGKITTLFFQNVGDQQVDYTKELIRTDLNKLFAKVDIEITR